MVRIMTVRFRLREFLEERGITQTEVHVKTGLAFSTVNALCNNKPSRIELDTLNLLCNTLNCSLEDIIEHVPEKKKK